MKVRIGLIVLVAVLAAGCSRSGGAPSASTSKPCSGLPVKCVYSSPGSSKSTTTYPGFGSVPQQLSNGASVELMELRPESLSGYPQINPVPAGDRPLSANVFVCAPARSSENFDPHYFTLKMKDSTTAESAGAVWLYGQVHSSDQPAGTCVGGKVAFDVPSGEVPATLLFEMPGSGETLRWKVG